MRQGTVAYITAEDEKALLYKRIIAAYRGVVGLSPEEIAAAEPATKAAEIDSDKGSFVALTVPPLALPIKTYVGNAFRFGDEAAEAAFVEEMLRVQPSLVVLDPLKDLVPAKGGFDQYFVALISHLPMLRQLRDKLGCSFLIVTHTNKNVDLQGDDAALWGSSLVTASFDTRWIAKELPQPCAGRQAMLLRRKLKVTARPPLAYFEHGTDERRSVFEFDAREVDSHESKRLGERALDEVDAKIIAAAKKGPKSMRGLHEAAKEAGVGLGWTAFHDRVKRLLREGRLRQDDQERVVAGNE